MRMAFRYSDVECADPSHEMRVAIKRFEEYDDPTGELAYVATRFDSFYHNDPGYAIAFPVTNTDTRGFVGDKWYEFED